MVTNIMGLKKEKGSGFIDCCRHCNSEKEVEDFVKKVEEYAKKHFGCQVVPEHKLLGQLKFRAFRRVKSAEAQGAWEVKVSRWSPHKAYSIYVKAEYRVGEFEGIDAFESDTGINLNAVGTAWSGKYTDLS